MPLANQNETGACRWLTYLKGNGLVHILIIAFLLALSVSVGAAKVEVTKSYVGADNNGRYDRNPSYVEFGGEYWLFYAKGDIGTTGGVRNENYNPDNDSYVIWYKRVSVPDTSIMTATETRLDLSETNRPEGFDQRDVSAIVFDNMLYVFASAGFGGSQQSVYYYTWDGTLWSGPISLGTIGGGHVNAVCDADRVYLSLETGVAETLQSIVYTWDGITLNGPFTVALGNGVPKITLKDGKLCVVSIAPSATTINLHVADAGATPSTWTYLSDPITVSDAYVWDPSICNDGVGLLVLAAPSTAVPDRQWIVQTRSFDNGLTWTPVKTVSSGGSGSATWWDYWPVAWSDTPGHAFIFFTTEGKDGVYADGMIGGIGVDWNPDHDHTFYIQPAIDAAAPGDTVLVAVGTFTGTGNRDLDFGGKGIMLKSNSDPGETTVIDCQGSVSDPHYGIFFHSGEDAAAIVDGFTITNAYNDFGAVRCSTSAPIIINCIISGNNPSGVYASNGSNPQIIRCTLSDNVHYGVAAAYTSGVMYSPYLTTITIDSCVISGNITCGVRLVAVDATITRSDISGNGNIGISADGQTVLDVSSTLIRDNGNYGLWIILLGGYVDISNCTIVGNVYGMFYDGSPPKSGQVSGGQQSETSIFTRNIVAFNRSKGIMLGTFAWWVPYRFECTDAYGNPDGDWPAGDYGPGDAYGDFSLDPLFCDTTAHDYHISSTSYCTPTYSPCQALVGRFGIGCTLPFVCGDVNDDGTPNIADAVYLVNYVFRSGAAPNPLCAGDANGDGGTNVGDAVYMIAYVFKGGAPPVETCCQ